MKNFTKLMVVISMLLAFAPSVVHAETIYQLTNNSGGTVSSGTLVVIDTTATDSFTTSTAAYDAGMWGVVPFRSNGATVSIADGSRGPIQVSGVSQITCDEAIAIGDYISTSTSNAGQGTGDTGQPERFIGRALEADASNPYNPTVLIIPHTSSNFDISFTAPATAGSDFDIIEVNINIDSLDASSEVHAFGITVTGTSSGVVAGLATHGSNVDPIHQHIGTFVTPSQTEYAGEIPSGGSWSDGLDAKTIFEDVDDAIFIGGDAVAFDEVEVIMSTPASQAEFAVYEFLNDSAAWVEFIPGDSTNDWQQNGIISWESDGFTNWDAAGDPGGASASAGYWIKVKRERNTVITDPVITTIKILDPTEYKWDENGDLIIRDLDTRNITPTGVVNASSATSLSVPDSADPTVNAPGEIATESNGDGSVSSQGLFTFYSGGTQYWGISVADLSGLSDNDVPAFDSGTNTIIMQAQASSVTQSSDLSDYGVTTPTDGNIMRADGDSWESDILAHSDITAGDGSDHGDVVTNSTHGGLTNDPHSVTKAQVGLTDVADILDKLDATQPPTVNNDVDEGYLPGSRWFDVTNDKVYACTDNTDGAAVWTETTAGAAGGETNTMSNVGTDGVGVWYQKAGVDFEMRHVAPASSKITVVLNGQDIDVDVDLTQLWDYGAGSMEAPNTAGNFALANTGEWGIKADEDAIAARFSGGEIADEAQISFIRHAPFTIIDPGAVYDNNAQVHLFEIGPDAPNGITIVKWSVRCNVDPDVEVAVDLKRATVWIGLTGATIMDVMDTTNGVASEDVNANINGGAVIANGSHVYLEITADPTGTCDQYCGDIWFYAEED